VKNVVKNLVTCNPQVLTAPILIGHGAKLIEAVETLVALQEAQSDKN
jgi:hypothetical protein